MIELECLAAAWGMHKCRQFLEGLLSFELVTDHKPLIPILNSYALDKLDNPRLLRLRLKMQRYAFTARWIPGKENQDSDALSRAPIAPATPQDELALFYSPQDHSAVSHRRVRPESHRSCLRKSESRRCHRSCSQGASRGHP